MIDLTKAEARLVVALIDATPPSFPVTALRDKLVRAIAEDAGRRSWGALVFDWQLPLKTQVPLRRGQAATTTTDLAPTLNVYGSMETWRRARLYKLLDARILCEMAKWPACRLGASLRARAVRVTRYSSHRPDELGVDVLGGKVPVDRLVLAGILRGDGPKDLEREARWEPAPPGHGSLRVQVHELE